MKKENIHNIKSSGFEVPEDYFDTLEDQLLERIYEKELITSKENPGFTVPNNYFDTVDDNIMSQFNTEEKPVIRLNSRKALYYVTGFAASFVLLFSLYIANSEKININTIETASIENYLYQEDYSNEDLATLFITDDISVTDFIDVNISNEIINEYLENTDTEDFILN